MVRNLWEKVYVGKIFLVWYISKLYITHSAAVVKHRNDFCMQKLEICCSTVVQNRKTVV